MGPSADGGLRGPNSSDATYVAVIGPGHDASAEETESARRVGSLLAERDAIVVCGGLGGVMAAVCEGASAHDGVTIGLLPGRDRSAAAEAGNRYLSVVLPTGLGELRNGLVVNAADAVIAIGGSWGTLSEISLAMRTGKPTILIGGWTVESPSQIGSPPHRAVSAEDAVELALRLAKTAEGRRAM